jgi:hypothetical protein
MKIQSDNTMVNGAPNSENLDDFMRLDASFSYSFNFTAAISIRGGVINITDEESSTAITKSTTINNTVTVNNKSLGMTPNVSFRVNFNK